MPFNGDFISSELSISLFYSSKGGDSQDTAMYLIIRGKARNFTQCRRQG